MVWDPRRDNLRKKKLKHKAKERKEEN